MIQFSMTIFTTKILLLTPTGIGWFADYIIIMVTVIVIHIWHQSLSNTNFTKLKKKQFNTLNLKNFVYCHKYSLFIYFHQISAISLFTITDKNDYYHTSHLQCHSSFYSCSIYFNPAILNTNLRGNQRFRAFVIFFGYQVQSYLHILVSLDIVVQYDMVQWIIWYAPWYSYYMT